MSSHPEPWRRLRDLEPPLGARRRVLSNIEAELARGPRRGRLFYLAIPAAALVIATLWSRGDAVVLERARSLATPSVLPEGRVQQPDTSAPEERAPAPLASDTASARSAVPSTVEAPRVQLSERQHVRLELSDAEVAVRGPASLRVVRDHITAAEGTFLVAGTTTISAPVCKARVAGRARVSVRADRVRVQVFAGTAEVAPKSASCTVQNVLALGSEARSRRRPKRTGPAARSPKPEAAAHDRSAEPAVESKRAASSTLRDQVRAFREARALRGAAAVQAWRAFLARWPDSPLRPEVDESLRAAERRVDPAERNRVSAPRDNPAK